jgi:hydroxymethylpyrimidine pyrophosphatase-like HAD family hydrolase
MSLNSLEIIKNNFTMESCIEKHIILYNQLIKEKNEFHKIEHLDVSKLKTIVTDFDRTITDEPAKPEFDPSDIDAGLLDELKSLGLDLFLATGRSIYYVRELCQKFKVWKCVIAENGAVIYLPSLKKTITINTVHMAKARRIIRNLNLPNTVIGKVITSNRAEDEEIIRQKLGKLINYVDFVKNVDEIMIVPRNVTKGLGLKLAMQYLNSDMNKSIIVGEGENDIDMFMDPGFKVALANADEKLKKLANQVTEKPATQGVRELIEKLKTSYKQTSSTSQGEETKLPEGT